MGWQIISLICGSEKQKYVCKRGWTSHNCKGELICPSGKSVAGDEAKLAADELDERFHETDPMGVVSIVRHSGMCSGRR
jgi:hypothetical protein